MAYHIESDYIPVVLESLKVNGGSASFSEIRDYILNNFPLNVEDKNILPSGFPRWHQIVRNLKSNKVLKNEGLADEIRYGFAITHKGLAYI